MSPSQEPPGSRPSGQTDTLHTLSVTLRLLPVRHARALLPALLAALALFPAPGAAAATAPARLWEVGGFGPVRESSPLVVDVDGDGRLDVVFGSQDGTLQALGADGGRVPGWPQHTGHRVDSSAAAADTDRDGQQELFVGTGTYDASDARIVPAGALVSYEHDGRQRFRAHLGDQDFPHGGAVHSTPVLGDITGDGWVDVSVGSLTVQSIWSFDQSGRRHQGFPFYADDTVFSSAALLDVDGDQRRDIVIGADSSSGPGSVVDHRGGFVRAIGGDGRVIWEFALDDIVRSSPAVGDIDGDGEPEIVFGSGDHWGGEDSVKVFALDRQGRMKPGWPRTTDGVTNASPTLAELNGDGRLDVVIGTFDSRHGRGNGGTVWAWDGAGQQLSGFPRASGGGVVLGSIVTADLDGNGGQDLLVPTGGGIFAYSGRSGDRLFALEEGRTTFHTSPAVTDLDGNGRLDVVAAGVRANAGYAFRWELGAEARFGTGGWHQFRKDTRRTGSWTEDIWPSRAIATDRIAGADRYGTAAEIARRSHPGGANVVMLVSGVTYADALAGAPAAAKLGAPLLLVAPDTLPTATASALEALRPKRILVLGGAAAVTGRVVDEVASSTGVTPERVSGENRYATAAALAAAAFQPGVPIAYVAAGTTFADALAAGSPASRDGAPILLVEPGRLPAATADELERLRPGRIVVVGGPAAVNESVLSALDGYTSGSVERLGGVDRYDTAAVLARRSFPDALANAWVATGVQFADALVAGPAAAMAGSPLLLAQRHCVPDGTRAELERIGASQLLLLGGTGALDRPIGSLTRCE